MYALIVCMSLPYTCLEKGVRSVSTIIFEIQIFHFV